LNKLIISEESPVRISVAGKPVDVSPRPNMNYKDYPTPLEASVGMLAVQLEAYYHECPGTYSYAS